MLPPAIYRPPLDLSFTTEHVRPADLNPLVTAPSTCTPEVQCEACTSTLMLPSSSDLANSTNRHPPPMPPRPLAPPPLRTLQIWEAFDTCFVRSPLVQNCGRLVATSLAQGAHDYSSDVRRPAKAYLIGRVAASPHDAMVQALRDAVHGPRQNQNGARDV